MEDRTRAMPLRKALEQCLREASVSEVSRTRMASTVDRAIVYFERLGIERLADVGPAEAASFVTSRLSSGLVASVSTKHHRRSVLRTVLRAARRAGLTAGDPVVDVVLPPRSSCRTRPLANDEVELCRDVAWWTSSRVAGCWALAEATARGVELANVRKIDLDLDAGRVWIGGGRRTFARWGTLSEWGVSALSRRSNDIGTGLLVYAGSGGPAGQVSTCRAVGVVLLRAGLAAEPDVRPASVAGWAGRAVLDRTGRIEDAAMAMGVRSLDRAANLVAHSLSRS